MFNPKPIFITGTSALSFALAACGGGGGGVATVPPPPLTQPPRAQAAATTLPIIDDAPTGVLAVAGASIVEASDGPLPHFTIDPAKLPSFFYDASSDIYQIKLPTGGDWETLYSPNPENAVGNRTQAWTDSGVSLNIEAQGTLINSDTEWTRPYTYSTLVTGFISGFGTTLALGIPTPASGLPTTGAATFNGVVIGSADYLVNDGWGDMVLTTVGGTVTLNFDFGTSKLSGSMEPWMYTDFYAPSTADLGVFTFKDTVYSVGAYSGQFNTSASGLNGFNGQLTGPNGQELIGGWALPFHYSGDGQDHQAFGACVAKRP